MSASFHEIYNGKFNQRDASVQPLLKKAQKSKRAKPVLENLDTVSDPTQPQETILQSDLDVTTAVQ
jgi:hypothetical protein